MEPCQICCEEARFDLPYSMPPIERNENEKKWFCHGNAARAKWEALGRQHACPMLFLHENLTSGLEFFAFRGVYFRIGEAEFVQGFDDGC